MTEPRTIEELAAKLSLSEDALDKRRRIIRMKNPKDVDGQLLAWLRATYEENRDKVRLLGKSLGYAENFMGSLQIRGCDGEHEPEAVPEHVQNLYSLDARTRRAEEQERSEEAQKAQLRSFTEAMRQKIKKGEDIGLYLARAQRTEDAA